VALERKERQEAEDKKEKQLALERKEARSRAEERKVALLEKKLESEDTQKRFSWS